MNSGTDREEMAPKRSEFATINGSPSHQIEQRGSSLDKKPKDAYQDVDAPSLQVDEAEVEQQCQHQLRRCPQELFMVRHIMSKRKSLCLYILS